MKKIYSEAKSWPFEEARRIYERINGKTPAKGYVLFETGYGPSGLPHIGTFGEVVRTSFVRHAFSCIAPEIPTKMFCVSDDIDGLRKVPDNLPNPEIIRANLGKPLTAVPDPFGTHESYGHHMNARLRAFLDHFGFEYHFVSATEKYKSGEFDKTMLKVLEKYEEIMDVMLPSLGNERQETYSPFMPIDQESGIVIDKGVKGINKERKTVIYIDRNGIEKEVPVTGGNCKLQWKVDFGARWYSLDVDYEIYGKDHQPNEKIYRKLCEILGGVPPTNFTYEMFLSDTGEKISKSKGNGISVEDWLKYAPQESMALFMYQKPKTAKRLYFDVIPKAMDEYLTFVAAYKNEDEVKRLENPAFHIHEGKVPQVNFNLTYSLLLNLASACNPDTDSVLWGFISKYQEGLTKENSPLLEKMVKNAINYYDDFIKQHKKYREATEAEKLALRELLQTIKSRVQSDDSQGVGSQNNAANFDNVSTKISAHDAAALQNIVFEVGKNHGYNSSAQGVAGASAQGIALEKNMRDWFSALYQILLGQDQGPRMGSFIALFGVDNFIKMVEQKI